MTWAAIQRWLCGLWTGHAFLLVIERGRIYVTCDVCGKETPGWDVAFRSPSSNVVQFERRRA